MQLRPGPVEGAVDDGLGVGVADIAVFVGVGVTDPVVAGEGVVNGERIVNDSLALRCDSASLASMVCCPLDHDGMIVIVTSNVPSLRALMVLFPAAGIYNCAEICANECAACCAWSAKDASCVDCG